MKNTEKDWAALALEPAPEGFVSIGKGSSGFPLYRALNVSPKDIWAKEYEWGSVSENWSGLFSDTTYFLKKADWEKATGLDYSKIKVVKTEEVPIYIESSQVFNAAIYEIAEKKECKLFPPEKGSRFVYFHNLPEVAFSNHDLSGHGWKKVSLSEFFAALETLPDKSKSAVLEDVIPGIQVEVSVAGIKAGCQFYIPSDIKNLVAWVEEHRKSHTHSPHGGLKRHVPLKTLTIPSPAGIEVDGNVVSFEQFDKIIAEYNKFKK